MNRNQQRTTTNLGSRVSTKIESRELRRAVHEAGDTTIGTGLGTCRRRNVHMRDATPGALDTPKPAMAKVCMALPMSVNHRRTPSSVMLNFSLTIDSTAATTHPPANPTICAGNN